MVLVIYIKKQLVNVQFAVIQIFQLWRLKQDDQYYQSEKHRRSRAFRVFRWVIRTRSVNYYLQIVQFKWNLLQ